MTLTENGRSRKFCPYCGQMIEAKSIACRRHSQLYLLDAVPPDPLTSLPTMAQSAQTGEESTTRKGKES